jgi:hypothetical protein
MSETLPTSHDAKFQSWRMSYAIVVGVKFKYVVIF